MHGEVESAYAYSAFNFIAKGSEHGEVGSAYAYSAFDAKGSEHFKQLRVTSVTCGGGAAIGGALPTWARAFVPMRSGRMRS